MDFQSAEIKSVHLHMLRAVSMGRRKLAQKEKKCVDKTGSVEIGIKKRSEVEDFKDMQDK